MATVPHRLLHDSLLFTEQRFPHKTALVIEGEAYNYACLLDTSSRLAHDLVEKGLQRGDRVAVYMDNTWSCIVSIYAIMLAGGVFLVINPQTKSDKLEYILDDCDVRVLITDGHFANVFLPIVERSKKLASVISSGTLPELAQNLVEIIDKFDVVLKHSIPIDSPVSRISTDLSALIYTSGSTGNPKGVMQTHQSMIFSVGSLVEYQQLSEQDKILLVLPLAFDYGLYQLLMSVHIGATLVVERSFTYPAQVFKRIEEQQVTVFPAVPTIFSMILSAHGRDKLCFESITRVTNTAAALPAEIIPDLKEVFPNALIYKMYGLTECKRVCYLEPELLDEKPTSVGKAIPGTEVFLRSPEGEEVTTGEPGILHVRGPHIMLGYWNQSEQSEKMLKEGGLPGERILCTQDWFCMDQEGFLYFKGRSDDMLKTRGEKVSPIEVENTLHGIDGIKEAAVIGVPDDLFGEAIWVYVSLDEGASLNARQIKKICLSKLENFMVPTKVVFLDELPKTTTGKISKKLLKELDNHE